MSNLIVRAIWKHEGVKYRWSREWFYNSLFLTLKDVKGDSVEFFKKLNGEEHIEKEVLMYGFIPCWKLIKSSEISNYLEMQKSKSKLHQILIDKYGFQDKFLRE